MRRLKSEGCNQTAPEKKRFLMMVDQGASVPCHKAKARQNKRAGWLRPLPRCPKLESTIEPQLWREAASAVSSATLKLGPSGLRESRRRDSFHWRFGGCHHSIQRSPEVWRGREGTMSHRSDRGRWRYGAGVAALAGTITEMSGLAAEKVAPTTQVSQRAG